MKAPVLYIVIPCYNEEEALPITAKRMAELLDDLTQKGLIDARSRVTLVDDGSRDKTTRYLRVSSAPSTQRTSALRA